MSFIYRIRVVAPLYFYCCLLRSAFFLPGVQRQYPLGRGSDVAAMKDGLRLNRAVDICKRISLK